MNGFLKPLAYKCYFCPHLRLSPGQGLKACFLQSGWLTASRAAGRELPETLLLKNAPLPADRGASKTAELSNPPQMAKRPTCNAQLGGAQGCPGGCQGIRSVLSPTRGGTFLSDEVRLRSHVGSAGEGRCDPVRTQEAQSLFLLMSNETSEWPPMALPNLSNLSPFPKNSLSVGTLSPDLPEAIKQLGIDIQG